MISCFLFICSLENALNFLGWQLIMNTLYISCFVFVFLSSFMKKIRENAMGKLF